MIGLMGLTVRDDEQSRRRHRDQVTRACVPAEKLYEELLIGNNVTGTDHPTHHARDGALASWSASSGCWTT